MKGYIRCIALAAGCAALLFSCGHASKLVGTWQGDGTLDMLEMEAPYEFAAQWAFGKDGTAEVTVGEETAVFRYSVTDDTLTLNDGELSWGVLYAVNGDTFCVETGSGPAVFTKVR